MPLPKDKTKVKEWKQKISNTLKGRRCCMRTEFARGHIPHNKGTIGLMKVNKGSFKKGDIPNNYMGGLKICRDGIYAITDDKYTYEYNGKKVIARKYENLSRKKYREHYGDFDKSMVILHKDGDVYNNEIENLKLITRKELLKINNEIKHKKNCFICGKEFLARRKNFDKTCSEKCYKENVKLLAKKYLPEYRAVKKLLLANVTIK